MQRLYHYTNVDALALILKNKTIRFKRLDTVDDIEEGHLNPKGIQFCKYVFTSCWTKSHEENIPLWSMYGRQDGVRISLPLQMFQKYDIYSPYITDNPLGHMTSLIPKEDLFNDRFMVFPFIDYNKKAFFRDVKYVAEINEKLSEAILFIPRENGTSDLYISMESFGSYKHNRWEFQNESRFVLYIFPFGTNSMQDIKPEDLANCLLNNKNLDFDYYDLRLNQSALDDLIITLSPAASESKKIIVDSLIKEYAPNAKLETSSLGKLVRLK